MRRRERESRWLTNGTLPEHFDLAVPWPPGFILLLELALLLLGLVSTHLGQPLLQQLLLFLFTQLALQV